MLTEFVLLLKFQTINRVVSIFDRSSLSSDRSIESSCHENKSLSNGLNKLKDLGSFSEREASFKTPSIKRLTLCRRSHCFCILITKILMLTF